VISESHIVNGILRRRRNKRDNYTHLSIYQWVCLGDGDDYQIRLVCDVNKNTGNVCVTSSLRFRGGGCPIHPGKNSGMIDVDDIPLDVLNRYRNYDIRSDNNRRLKRRIPL